MKGFATYVFLTKTTETCEAKQRSISYLFSISLSTTSDNSDNLLVENSLLMNFVLHCAKEF